MSRVVTRYMGSGIKGLKKGGIRDHSLGSGIKALGIGISVFSMGSRIRRLDNNKTINITIKKNSRFYGLSLFRTQNDVPKVSAVTSVDCSWHAH